jgi:hypothetical protein
MSTTQTPSIRLTANQAWEAFLLTEDLDALETLEGFDALQERIYDAGYNHRTVTLSDDDCDLLWAAGIQDVYGERSEYCSGQERRTIETMLDKVFGS